jgi:hypothetical protein
MKKTGTHIFTSRRRVLLAWLGGVGLAALSHIVLPHHEVSAAGFMSFAVQLLLFIIAVTIARHEPTGKNRAIFVNFAVFFGTSILFHLSTFVGHVVLREFAYARLYVSQYLSLGGYYILLAFAVVYVAVDALFREFRMVSKYLLTLLIVGAFVTLYYGPLVADPLHLYKTETAQNWRELDKSFQAFQKEQQRTPSPGELAAVSNLHSWKDGVSVGVLYPDERVRRVEALYPYLLGTNWIILLTTPLYMNVVFMNVLCVGFILLFFGYQYRKDPPQGAYLDKIMFLLLVLCSTEILHAWSFIKSVEWTTFAQLFAIGQYVSIAILLLITAFFALRLRWITSVNGEFYELEIAARPGGITRWRDWLDEFLIAHFFNRRAILGRLFERGDGERSG